MFFFKNGVCLLKKNARIRFLLFHFRREDLLVTRRLIHWEIYGDFLRKSCIKLSAAVPNPLSVSKSFFNTSNTMSTTKLLYKIHNLDFECSIRYWIHSGKNFTQAITDEQRPVVDIFENVFHFLEISTYVFLVVFLYMFRVVFRLCVSCCFPDTLSWNFLLHCFSILFIYYFLSLFCSFYL